MGGIAAGWIARGNRLGDSKAFGRREAVAFGALGALADIDLLFGIHSGPTHGIGAAVLAGTAVWLPGVWHSSGALGGARIGIALACMLAYGSHILLDWLGTDTSAPIGIMALWPFSHAYYESGVHLFMAVSRRIWQPALFWWHNTVALARELLILLPVVLAIGLVRRAKSVRRAR